MDTFEAIEKRRSIKHFDPNHQMSDDEINLLIKMAMWSPTAFNIQHWRFVVVKNPEIRQKIREHSWNQSQVTDSSLLIILCADLRAWEKEPQRYWRNAPQQVQDILLPAIANYYKDNPMAERDEAMRSCGMAAQTLMLAAKAMGYDSCPMDGFDFDEVAKIINLPEDHALSMFVCIGKATKEANPRSGPINVEEAVVIDHF